MKKLILVLVGALVLTSCNVQKESDLTDDVNSETTLKQYALFGESNLGLSPLKNNETLNSTAEVFSDAVTSKNYIEVYLSTTTQRYKNGCYKRFYEDGTSGFYDLFNIIVEYTIKEASIEIWEILYYRWDIIENREVTGKTYSNSYYKYVLYHYYKDIPFKVQRSISI